MGGDLAYCRGGPEGYARWQQWFADWDATMRTPDGRLIPIVAAIGNHDRATSAATMPAKRSRAVLQRIPLPGSGGPELLRAPLRPARSALRARLGPPRAAGRRAARLARGGAARERRRTGALCALSRRALPGPQPISKSVAAGREAEWLPLFDAFRLTAAFENHGHLHKRTLPLRAGVPVARWQRHGLLRRRLLGQVAPEEPACAERELSGDRVRAPPLLEGHRVGAGRALRRRSTASAHVFDRAAQDASGAWIRE